MGEGWLGFQVASLVYTSRILSVVLRKILSKTPHVHEVSGPLAQAGLHSQITTS